MTRTQAEEPRGDISKVDAVRIFDPLPAIKTQKASDVLAGELRTRIVNGSYSIGDLLPAERTLSETCQVSRTTVREALRILEVQELIEIRPGRSGGAVVRHPSPQLVADSLDMLIRAQRIELQELLDARKAIEPTSARLAAIHRTNEELAEIEAAQETLIGAIDGPHLDFNRANLEWHSAISRASHNRVLISVMNALSPAIYRSTEMESVLTRPIREATALAHRKITEAIAKQRPEEAGKRMTAHVTAAADELEEFAVVQAE